MTALGGLAAGSLRRRWRTALVLVLALGIGVGAGLSCIAAARRTASAYPRYLRDADAPNLIIDYSPQAGDTEELTKAARAIDGVVSVRDVAVLTVLKASDAGEPDLDFPYAFFAPSDTSTEIANRPHVVEGRLPRPDVATEVLINPQLAAEKHVKVGDHLALVWVSNDEVAKAEEGEPFDVEDTPFDVVGIGVFSDEVIVDDIAGETGMLGTEPFARTHLGGSSYHRLLVQVAPGTKVTDVIAGLRGSIKDDALSGQLLFQDRNTAIDKAQRSLRPLVLGLTGIGLLLAAATLLLIGQALARQISQDHDDSAVLRALGVTGSSRTGLLLAMTLAVAIGGGVVAALVALALSPLAPVGAVRAVEITGGVQADSTVLLAGALAMLVVLLARSAVATLPALRTRSGGVDRAGRLGALVSVLSVTSGLGVRSALEPGGGRTRVAARATIATAAAAVFAVAALATFDAGRRHLSDDPALYGWTWDVALQAGAGYSQIDLDALEADKTIGDLAGVEFASLAIGGDEVPAMLVHPVRGVVTPSIVEGRAPRTFSELAMGHDTLARSGKHVGDVISIDEPGDDTREHTIVGVAVFPALGLIDTERANLGTGVFSVMPSGPVQEFGPSTALIRAAPGTSREELIDHLEKTFLGDASDIKLFDRARPADLASFERLGSGPMVAVGLFVLATVATLAHGVISAVRRRRRDHGLLRALGMAPGQIRAVVIWQAITTIGIALVIGVPLGVVAGRAGWRAVADGIGTQVELIIPALFLLALALALLVGSVLVALLPARAAARMGPGEALRAE